MYEKKRKQDFQRILSELSGWLSLVDVIDEKVYNWSKLSAKYVGKYFNTVEFIENLYSHSEQTPNEVASLYIEMLKNCKILFDHPQDTIEKIVRTLYQAGQKKYANNISNKYGENGFYFLKDLYKKYNGYE